MNNFQDSRYINCGFSLMYAYITHVLFTLHIIVDSIFLYRLVMFVKNFGNYFIFWGGARYLSQG